MNRHLLGILASVTFGLLGALALLDTWMGKTYIVFACWRRP
jgi:hypothetical protein